MTRVVNVRGVWLLAGLVLLGACSSSSAPSPAIDSGPLIVDAHPTEPIGVDMSVADTPAPGDAPSDSPGTADQRIDSTDGDGARRPLGPPLNHRPSSVPCPLHHTDGGADGGDAGPTECAADDDCGGTTGGCACEPLCNVPPFTTHPNNRCLPGNCRVDSDCGAGGYCSPSIVPGVPNCSGLNFEATGFYCHTPNDECNSDSDCPGTFPETHCLYFRVAGNDRWRCGDGP